MSGKVQVIPQVSQESFDDVVRENIADFEMEAEEALKDAVDQFKSQGVDLGNVMIRVPLAEGEIHPAVSCLEAYKELVALEDVSLDALQAIGSDFAEHMSDKAVRIMVAAEGAIVVLLAACDKFAGAQQEPQLAEAIRVMNACLQGQPDLLGRVQTSCLDVASGLTATPTPEIMKIMAHLKAYPDSSAIQAAVLKTVRFGSFMHESNRQAFVAAGVIEFCLAAAEKHAGSQAVVVASMQALRALTRDDDPRVPFGKATEHAKMIAEDAGGLKRLLVVLQASGTCDAEAAEADPKAAAELFKTLSQLATRDEFCKQIVDFGCLDYVLPALARFNTNETVAHSGCTLLRAVAGNDEVKKIIGDRGGIGIIVDTMEAQLKSEKVAEQGNAAFAALCLKQQGNAAAVAAANGPHVIVKTMYLHPQAKKLQRQACMALRNIVVRNPELVDDVLGQGAENAINVALQNHPEDCKDEAKAALRDLGCDVHLIERWTGKLKTENLDLDGSVRPT